MILRTFSARAPRGVSIDAVSPTLRPTSARPTGESIESVPDTMVHPTMGNRVIVQESADEVVQRVVAFRRRVAARTRHLVSPNDAESETVPRSFDTRSAIAS